MMQKEPPELLKGVLKNFTKFPGKHLCQCLHFDKVCNFIKIGTLAQAFSYEFCKIFKNIFFIERFIDLNLHHGYESVFA